MLPIIPTSLGLSPIQMPSVPDIAYPSVGATNPTAATAGQPFEDFGTLLGNAIDSINSTQATADASATALITGQSTDLHTVMIDMQKAKTTLDLAVQVRNKTLDAYNELMHTPV